MKTIFLDVLLKSDLISIEDSRQLSTKFAAHHRLTAEEILSLDLPTRNRVEALLRPEFLTERQLRELACDFVEHTLYIFENRAPLDNNPRTCIEIARLYLKGAASLEGLQAATSEAIQTVWRFEGTEFVSVFEAGFAATFLSCEDAAEMSQIAALYTQRAAHHREWEDGDSNFQPMIAREIEAAWQLKSIAKNLRQRGNLIPL